ncbi:hypothetical protein [Clostridium sp.]|uniref:hypothetical protein n=1 Tax=Clostridium sp. TaxID=1506 RepID=UPI003F4C9F5A
MRLFGPTYEDIWKILSEDIGAKIITNKDLTFKNYEVIKEFHNWIIILDTCESGNRSNIVYTRVSCVFLNKHGFKFKMFGEYFNNYFPNFFDMQDIKAEYDDLSDNFVVRSNSEIAIKIFLENSNIRQLISIHPDILLEIISKEDHELIANTESTLSVKIPGVIKNNEVLKNLFELIAESLLEIEKIENEIENLQVNNFTHFDVIKNSFKNGLLQSDQYINLKRNIINNVNNAIGITTNHYSHKKNQVSESELVNKDQAEEISYTENKSSVSPDTRIDKAIETASTDKVIETASIDTNSLSIDTRNLKIDDSYLKSDDSYLKNDDSYLKGKE